jgi:predicted transcriptional regulator
LTRCDHPRKHRSHRSHLYLRGGDRLIGGGPGGCTAPEYDSCMKRITVSLPDELVEKIKRAAGGKRQVSSYVATALEDYQERETLDDILAAWREETPVPEEVQRQVEAELDNAGLTGLAEGGDRLAG